MSLETASSSEKAAPGDFNIDGVSASDGLPAHDHQRNDENPMTNGMPQPNGQNVMAHNHSDPSRHLPVPNWEGVLSTIQQLQDIESVLSSTQCREGKVTLWDIIETGNKLVPALKQLVTTYNERNDGLEKLRAEYRQALTETAENTSKVEEASKATDLREAGLQTLAKDNQERATSLKEMKDRLEAEKLQLAEKRKSLVSVQKWQRKEQERIKTWDSDLIEVRDKLAGVVRSWCKDEQSIDQLSLILQVKKLSLRVVQIHDDCLLFIQHGRNLLHNAQEKASEKISGLKSETSDLQNDKIRLQSDLDTKEADCNKAEDDASRLREDIGQLGREKTGLQSDLDVATSSLHFSGKKNRELEDELQHLRREKSIVDAQLMTALDEKARLHDDAQKLSAERTELQSNLTQEKTNLSTRNAENTELSRLTTEQQARLAGFVSAASSDKKLHDDLEAAHDQTLHELKLVSASNSHLILDQLRAQRDRVSHMGSARRSHRQAVLAAASLSFANKQVQIKEALIIHLGQKINARDATIIDFGQEIKTRDNKIVDLGQEIKTRDTTIVHLGQDIKTRDTTMAGFDLQIQDQSLNADTLLLQVDVVRRQRDTAIALVKEFGKVNVELTEQAFDLRAECTAHEASQEVMNIDREQDQVSLGLYEADQKQHKRQYVELQQSLVESEQACSAEQKNTLDVKTHLDRSRQEVEELRGRCTKTDAQLSSEQAVVSNLKDRLRTALQHSKDLDARVEQLEHAEQISEDEDSVPDDNERITLMEKENSTCRAEISRLQDIVDKFEAQAENVRAEAAEGENEEEMVESSDVPAIFSWRSRSKFADKRNDANQPTHKQQPGAPSSAPRDEGVTTKRNVDIPSSSHRSRHHVEAFETESEGTVDKQVSHASRPIQSKRPPSPKSKAPPAKRPRTSGQNAPEIQGGQESEDESSVALSIEMVGKPAFSKDPIPMAVWDRIRKQMGDWDRKKPKWRMLQDTATCPDAYARKRPSHFDYGLDYSCSHCRQHGDVCVVVRDGEMKLRPIKDSAEPDHSSVGHWMTADSNRKA